MAFQIPTVTVADLRDFHARHFPHAPAPDQVLHGIEPTEEYYDDEEGGLGHYQDGTPRTLTNEQIAMFRHSEIQAIIRKRRQQRDNGDRSETGEVEDSDTEGAAKVVSPASQRTAASAPDVDKVVSGRIEKLKAQQWSTSSPRTKARNKRNRDKYKARKKGEKFKRGLAPNDHDADEESDEWDPWHQAKGPDVQKDDTVDLDY